MAILLPDYADNNFMTIKEEHVDQIPKRNYTTKSGITTSDTMDQLTYLYIINDDSTN